MLGLSEPHYNAAKAAAKKCSAEIKGQIQKGKKYDEVAGSIITKHFEPVHLLTEGKVTRTKFIWICGYLNGRFGTAYDYE